MNLKSDFGIIFWLHLFIILFWYASPLLISWQYMLIIVCFSYFQGILINGCVLTKMQYGKEGSTFWAETLEKVGVKVNKKVFKIIFFWLEPIIVFVIGLIVQIIFNFKPILI